MMKANVSHIAPQAVLFGRWDVWGVGVHNTQTHQPRSKAVCYATPDSHFPDLPPPK